MLFSTDDISTIGMFCKYEMNLAKMFYFNLEAFTSKSITTRE
jgi:hypothetical protein